MTVREVLGIKGLEPGFCRARIQSVVTEIEPDSLTAQSPKSTHP